jgi:hypothetical protein
MYQSSARGGGSYHVFEAGRDEVRTRCAWRRSNLPNLQGRAAARYPRPADGDVVLSGDLSSSFQLARHGGQLGISQPMLDRWRAGRRASNWRCWSGFPCAATWASCSAARCGSTRDGGSDGTPLLTWYTWLDGTERENTPGYPCVIKRDERLHGNPDNPTHVGENKMSKKPFAFALLENGLDFIASAIEHLRRNASKRDVKHGVLHLASGVELVLKERLRREHWALIFEQPDKAESEAYEAGEFESVKFESCIKRLKGVGGVEFDDSDLVTLRSFREKRNRLEHFGIVETYEAVLGTSVKVLEIVVKFINENLEPEELEGEAADLMRDIRRGLGDLEAFVSKRWKTIKAEVEGQSKVTAIMTCPDCMQEALILDDGTKCLFCGYAAEGGVAAEAFVSRVLGLSKYRVMKDGGEWPVSECPECGGSLVDLGAGGHQHPTTQYVCFSCGDTWQDGALTSCSHCSCLFSDDDDGVGVCHDCWNAMMAKE